MTTRQKRARRQSILYRFRGRICCEFREQAPGTPNPKPYSCTLMVLDGILCLREAASFPRTSLQALGAWGV